MNEHGYCQFCKASLDGGFIYDTMLEQCDGNKEEAKKACEMYGTSKRWGR